MCNDENNINDENNVSKLRKAQEGILDLLKGGYYKELCKLQKAMFDEYIKIGFTEEQALRLILSMGKTNA